MDKINLEELQNNQFATYGFFGGGALFLIGLLYIIKYQNNKGLRPGEMLNFDKLDKKTRKILSEWKCSSDQDISCPQWKEYCTSRDFEACKIGSKAQDTSDICMYKDKRCSPRKFLQYAVSGDAPLKVADINDPPPLQRLNTMIAINNKQNKTQGGSIKSRSKKRINKNIKTKKSKK